MQTESSARPLSVTTDIHVLATCILKLDKYFTDPDARKQYLTNAGWLNVDGLAKLQHRWTPHALCATIMKASAESLPKTQEVVSDINALIEQHGCKILLKVGIEEGFFGVECASFFWFGGVRSCKR